MAFDCKQFQEPRKNINKLLKGGVNEKSFL